MFPCAPKTAFHAITAAACLALAATAHAGYTTTIGVANGGLKLTWSIDPGVPFASIHITGPAMGEVAVRTDPAGWNFTGSSSTGDYSWETTNGGPVSGPVNFAVNFQTLFATEAGTLSYDTQNTDGTHTDHPVDKPATPTAGNWVFVPVPEPGTMGVLAAAAASLLFQRRRKSPSLLPS